MNTILKENKVAEDLKNTENISSEKKLIEPCSCCNCENYLINLVQAEEPKNEKFEKAIKAKKFRTRVSKSNLKDIHEASTIVISCVDFRLRDELTAFVSKQLGLLDEYDELVLPGGSLALVASAYPCWKTTSIEVIGILKGLHKLSRVIFLDHRGCGAYRIIKGTTPETELEHHTTVMREAKSIILAEFPEFEVYMLLMGLDGVIDQIY